MKKLLTLSFTLLLSSQISAFEVNSESINENKSTALTKDEISSIVSTTNKQAIAMEAIKFDVVIAPEAPVFIAKAKNQGTPVKANNKAVSE